MLAGAGGLAFGFKFRRDFDEGQTTHVTFKIPSAKEKIIRKPPRVLYSTVVSDGARGMYVPVRAIEYMMKNRKRKLVGKPPKMPAINKSREKPHKFEFYIYAV